MLNIKFPNSITIYRDSCILFLVSCVLCLTSCSNRILFTQDIRKKFEAQKIDLKKIQYYNSMRFVIKRKLSSEEINLASGKVRSEGGIYYEQIIIKKNTPGICDSLNDYNMYISFETGKDFCFTRYYNDLFNPYYKINTNLKLQDIRQKEISYNKKNYQFLTKTDKIYLKIKKESLKHLQIDKKILQGVKISE